MTANKQRFDFETGSTHKVLVGVGLLSALFPLPVPGNAAGVAASVSRLVADAKRLSVAE
jgi:hypothetical protein